MCVGRGRKWDPLFEREPNNRIARVKFVHRFAPAGGGKFDRQIAGTDEFQRFIDDRSDVSAGAMSVNLDQIEMRQTIDQSGRNDLANPAKIIRVDFVNIAADKLPDAI